MLNPSAVENGLRHILIREPRPGGRPCPVDAASACVHDTEMTPDETNSINLINGLPAEMVQLSTARAV
jgi:hypothetical protein